MQASTNWILYVLLCSDGTFYTGVTNNFQKRLRTHNLGKGSKYTRCRLPCRMLAVSSQHTKSECLKAEAAFKKLRKKEKEIFISQGLDSFFQHYFQKICTQTKTHDIAIDIKVLGCVIGSLKNIQVKRGKVT